VAGPSIHGVVLLSKIPLKLVNFQCYITKTSDHPNFFSPNITGLLDFCSLYGFSAVLLLLSLFCEGYCLPILTWFDLVKETFAVSVCSLSMDPVRILIVPLSQQPFHVIVVVTLWGSSPCPFALCYHLVRLFRKALIFLALGIIIRSIVYYLFRSLYCHHCLGFVVRVSIPLWLLYVSSSWRSHKLYNALEFELFI
jgi:hypothetical protein